MPRNLSLDKEKINAILFALVANGLNYTLTAKQNNVKRTSLLRWAKKAGIAGGSKIPLDLKNQLSEQNKQATNSIVTPVEATPPIIITPVTRTGESMEERKKQLELDVMDIKEAAAFQIKASIPRTFDTEKLAKTMKILDEIVYGPSVPAIPPGEGAGKTTNYIQVIMEQLKYMEHEPTKD